jgi:hypothetical protein
MHLSPAYALHLRDIGRAVDSRTFNLDEMTLNSFIPLLPPSIPLDRNALAEIKIKGARPVTI